MLFPDSNVMASRQHRGMMAAEGPAIKSFGTFVVQDSSGQRTLTLSKALQHEPFPIETGTELKVEQIIGDDEEAYLRLTPVDS